MLTAGKDKIEHKDWMLLLLAFLCMLPTDILMSLVVVDPNLGVGGWVFMVGGGLSVLAHLFLIIRVGRGLGYLKHLQTVGDLVAGTRLCVRADHNAGPVAGSRPRGACRHRSDLYCLLLHNHVVCLGDGAAKIVSSRQRLDGGSCRHLLVYHRDSW